MFLPHGKLHTAQIDIVYVTSSKVRIVDKAFYGNLKQLPFDNCKTMNINVSNAQRHTANNTHTRTPFKLCILSAMHLRGTKFWHAPSTIHRLMAATTNFACFVEHFDWMYAFKIEPMRCTKSVDGTIISVFSDNLPSGNCSHHAASSSWLSENLNRQCALCNITTARKRILYNTNAIKLQQ